MFKKILIPPNHPTRAIRAPGPPILSKYCDKNWPGRDHGYHSNFLNVRNVRDGRKMRAVASQILKEFREILQLTATNTVAQQIATTER